MAFQYQLIQAEYVILFSFLNSQYLHYKSFLSATRNNIRYI